MGKETKNLVLEVSAGILLFTAAAAIVAAVVYPEPSVFAGLFLGMIIAIAMFLSMAVVLEGSMRIGDPSTVQKRSVTSTVVRYLLLVVILVVIIIRFSDIIHPIGVVIGVFGLKAGAYFQPVLHKIISRRRKED